MGFLSSIFTWWDGATIGTKMFSRRHGRQVGTDAAGNAYFASRDGKRRWVIYEGSNDSSRVPAEWHGWLHGTHDVTPDEAPVTPREWIAPPLPNLTGTASAYRPAGALERGGQRAAATGDYRPWTPGEA